MSFSTSFLTNLQNTIEHLQKTIDERSGKRSDSDTHHDLNERVSNIERAIIHIIARLDKAEDAKSTTSHITHPPKPMHFIQGSERSNSSVEDALILSEKMLRDVMIELLKQQNTIEKYRQEIEILKDKAPQKKQEAPSNPSSTLSTSLGQQRPPLSMAPPQHTKSASSSASKPSVASSSKKAPSKPTSTSSLSKRSDDEGNEAEVDAETIQNKLHVDFPPGYNKNRGRRFSVAGESYNPSTDFTNVQRNIFKKSPEARNRIRTVITNNILFKMLDEEQLEDLIDEMFEMRRKPDEVIIRQGDDGDNFYVVDSGELYVLYKDVVVATIGVGKAFGEIALMYMCPRTATVKAKTDVILWGMSRDTFRRSLMYHAIRKRELYESFLARVPLLESLLPYERSIIADALESKAFKDSEFIIREGDKGDAFYIIEKGRVVVTKGSPPVEVKSCSEGDYFGELALLTDQPRAANVRAIGLVRVLYLRREDFSALMGPCEEILKRNTQIYNQINAALNKSLSAKTNGETSRPKPQNIASLVSEFAQDENNYFQSLQVGLKEFLKPMRSASEAKTIPITNEEITQLFPSYEMLVKIHTILVEALPEMTANPSLFGKLLLKAAPGLKFHAAFNDEWHSVSQVLEKYKDDEAFQAFFKTPNRASLDLYDLLRLSHERLPKILGFLKDFVSLAPQDKDAAVALEKIEDLL